MRNKKNPKTLCLWSGGLDSTAMVWKLLSDGHDVDTIYTEIINNAEKTKAEKATRKELCKVIDDHAKECGVRFKDFGYMTKVEIFGTSNVVMPQMSVWMMSIVMSVDLHDYDNVAIGYVMNDDAISYLDDIRRVYNSYTRMFDQMMDKKPARLVFPLSKIHKGSLTCFMPFSVAEMTWTCEMPRNGEPCHECHPCKRRHELGIGPEKKMPRCLDHPEDSIDYSAEVKVEMSVPELKMSEEMVS